MSAANRKVYELSVNEKQQASSKNERGRKRMAAGCGSTGISPRPILMGAAHDALRASNARVSLSCLCILAHRLPHLFAAWFCRSPGLATGSWRTGRPADRLHTDRSYPSALCCAGGLPPGFLCQGTIRLCQPVKAYRFRYAFTERQTAHNGKRGKGTRSPHGLKDYPT